MFDKPPCDLLHGQSSRHLKGPFASPSSENGMHEEWITQRHPTPPLLGRQGMEFMSALTLRYGHNFLERRTRVAISAKEVKVATSAMEEPFVPKFKVVVLRLPLIRAALPNSCAVGQRLYLNELEICFFNDLMETNDAYEAAAP
jgi:hypothetical protein